MFKIAIGHSELPSPTDAVEEMVDQCRETLGQLKPNTAIIFSSTSYDYQQVLDEVNKRFPGIQIAGCSSIGEISANFGLRLGSINMMLIASDESKIYIGMATEIAGQEEEKMVQALSKTLEKAQNPSLCLLFADGLGINTSGLLAGIKKYFKDPNFPISGGGAADDWEFKKVYQFYNTQVVTNSAVFVIFDGPIMSSTAVRLGVKPLPSEKIHRVTKSVKNVVYEIDGKSAIQFYKDVIGEGTTTMVEYSLLLYEDEHQKEIYSSKSPFQVNQEEGSITYPDMIPENTIIRLGIRTTQELTLEVAKECVLKALESFKGKKVDAALIFSCALRKENLGTNTQKEIDLVMEALPKNTPIFGFYTYGEIGSYNPGLPAVYYNESIAVTLIGE